MFAASKEEAGLPRETCRSLDRASRGQSGASVSDNRLQIKSLLYGKGDTYMHARIVWLIERHKIPGAALAAALGTLFMTNQAMAHPPTVDSRATVSVYAEGLNNPRGLEFGPDGMLYVAEGGVGGLNRPPTSPDCQVVPPVGPYTGSNTGSRISRIDRYGNRTTVVDGLPSSQTSATLGSLVSGVADIAFVGKRLYAILAGAGCSHGVSGIPNSVIRIHHDGSYSVIADLGAYQRANPVLNSEEEDFEIDGTWYSMIAVRGDLYAVEPNHGEIVKVTTKGEISRVIDVSASQGHVVPTAIAYRGKFYVGNLGVFPQDAGSSNVWKVTPSGQIKLAVTGFNMVLGLAFDDHGQLYVLETSAFPAPAPGTGRIVRISRDGKKHDVIADGLFLPTGMTYGPDGNLYVSNVGFGPPPVGLGQVLKIDLNDDREDD
jgi:hypothetical protein